MGTIQDLRQAIATLETEIKALETAGIAQKDYSIDVSTRRGHSYHRLRWMEGGKRISEVIPDGSVGEWRGLVDRRRAWKQKRKELQQLQSKESKLLVKIQSMGGCV